MNNVVNLRNNPFKPGDKVHIGTSLEIFMVRRIGCCVPVIEKFSGVPGKMMNADEFVQLVVPGHNKVFEIHHSSLRLVDE